MNDQSILIVDSELERADQIAESLQEGPFHIFVSANSIESIDIIKEKHIQVLMINADMPGLQGTSLLNLIKNIDPNVCIILFASSTDSQETQFLPDSFPQNIEFINNTKAKTEVMKKVKQSLVKYDEHILRAKTTALHDEFQKTFPNVSEKSDFRSYYN